jgi:hypothetical protein
MFVLPTTRICSCLGVFRGFSFCQHTDLRERITGTIYATILLLAIRIFFCYGEIMPEFYKISFDADELDALKRACALLSEDEDRRLDEATSGDLETVVMQKERADDILLIKSTVSIFKPGQSILITNEDLGLLRKSLERLRKETPAGAIDRAIEKINKAGPA